MFSYKNNIYDFEEDIMLLKNTVQNNQLQKVFNYTYNR